LRTWVATAVHTLAIHTSRKSRKISDAQGRILPAWGGLEPISGEAANEAKESIGSVRFDVQGSTLGAENLAPTLNVEP